MLEKMGFSLLLICSLPLDQREQKRKCLVKVRYLENHPVQRSPKDYSAFYKQVDPTFKMIFPKKKYQMKNSIDIYQKCNVLFIALMVNGLGDLYLRLVPKCFI